MAPVEPFVLARLNDAPQCLYGPRDYKIAEMTAVACMLKIELYANYA